METKVNPKKKKAKPLKQKKITIGHKPDGSPIRKSFYGRNNKEISEKIREYERQQLLGKEQLSNILFNDWATEWLEKYKKNTVSYNTYKTTYLYGMRPLFEAFSGIKLSKIKPADLQEFFNSITNMSQSSIDRQFFIANNIFDTAIKNGLINKSPMIGVTKTRGMDCNERRAYSKEDYRMVIEFAMKHPDGIGPFILLESGLRRGELCALEWKDIDFNNRLLTVNKAVTRGDGDWVIKKPKTKYSIRTIPLADEFFNHLKTIDQKDRYVLGKGNNVIINPVSYSSGRYTRFMDDLMNTYPHLDRLTMHEMRHTFGTILYKSNTDIDTISKMMGHNNIETTRKIYVHGSVEDLRKRVKFFYAEDKK